MVGVAVGCTVVAVVAVMVTIVVVMMVIVVVVVVLATNGDSMFTLLFVGCLTSQQHANVSRGWIFSNNCTC